MLTLISTSLVSSSQNHLGNRERIMKEGREGGGKGTQSEILQITKSKETVKFPPGEVNSEIKWLSLLYRNLGNAAAWASVMMTQHQLYGFTSSRDVQAHALLQTSKKGQCPAHHFPCTMLVDFCKGEILMFYRAFVQETGWK